MRGEVVREIIRGGALVAKLPALCPGVVGDRTPFAHWGTLDQGTRAKWNEVNANAGFECAISTARRASENPHGISSVGFRGAVVL